MLRSGTCGLTACQELLPDSASRTPLLVTIHYTISKVTYAYPYRDGNVLLSLNPPTSNPAWMRYLPRSIVSSLSITVVIETSVAAVAAATHE